MNEQKSNYHWIMVAACFLLLAVSIGIVVNCFNPLSVALVNKFGSASSVQTIFTIAALTNLIGSALVGKVFSKASMRIAMPIYAILLSGGIYMWSTCESLNMFYIVAIFVGFGASGVAVVPCGHLINNWFEEKKGLATGIAFTGSVVGGAALVQMTQYLLNSYDLQTAYTALAIVAAAISIPTTLFVVREHPKDKGLIPYGAKDKGGEQLSLKGISLKQFIKTGSFWLLALGVFLVTFVNIGLQNNISICLTQTKGLSGSEAANIITIMFVIGIFAKLLLGAIYDKKGIAFGIIYCIIAYVVSAGVLIYTKDLTMAIVFAVLFTLVNAMTTVAPPYVTARIVGVKNYATIFGIMNLFYGIGLVTGPVVAAKIYDSTGSYDNAWMLFAGLAVVLGLAMIFAAKKGEGYSQMA